MLLVFKIAFAPLQAKAANSDTSFHFRFEICKKLGQGTYGKVQLGINKETGQQVTRKNLPTLLFLKSLLHKARNGLIKRKK